MLFEACIDACCRAHTGVRRFFSARLCRSLALFVGLALLFLFFYGIVGAGLPVLRHDWSVPPDRLAAFRATTEAFAGWKLVGIGAPNIYPINYIAGIILAPVTFVAGGLGEVVFILAITAVVAYYCARALRARSVQAIVASLAVLLLNPWSYNQFVAGHLYMPLSCFALFCLWRELHTETPSHRKALFFFVCSMQQMQFLLPAVVLTTVYARRTRFFTIYACTAAALLSPIALGTAAHFGQLQGIPNLSGWEASQSVPFVSGIQLMGYGPNYALHYGAIAIAQDVLFVLAMAAAIAFAPRARTTTILGAAAIIGVGLLASGTTGPIGAGMSWAFQHQHATGIYRELYDLIGLIVVAWLFILLESWRSFKPAAVCCIGIAILFAYTWTAYPPRSYFVSGSAVRDEGMVPKPASSRTALMPPFQPLSFHGRGSGLDPNAIGRAYVINSAFPVYPVAGALSRAWLKRDFRTLMALGVNKVIYRPQFKTLILNQQYVVALPMNISRLQNQAGETTLQGSSPVVGFLSNVRAGTVPAGFGANAISDADSCRVQRLLFRRCQHFRLSPITNSNAVTDPSEGWASVNALAYLSPAFGDLPNGYYTQARAPLPLNQPRSLLVDVIGSAFNGHGTRLTNSTHGLRWIALPPDTRAITCRGACTIVSSSPDVVPNVLPKGSASHVLPARYARPFDWLVVVDTPEDGAARVLRFSESFDSYWWAYGRERRRLAHFSIDDAINGWFVSPGTKQIYLVNIIAAGTELLEIIGALALTAALARFRCRALSCKAALTDAPHS